MKFKCTHPKRKIKSAGDVSEIWGLVPCENTATCKAVLRMGKLLHVERCWRGKPAQMVVVSGFGGVDSTIAETVGWPRFTEGSWKTVYGKNPPFTRSKKTLLVNVGFL